jgi:hypothetical protein
MASRAPFPGKPRGAEAQQLMTVGHCERKDRGVIVKPSLFLEGLSHGQPHLQELRPQRRRRRLLQRVRRGHHVQRPQPPLPRPAQETSLRTTDTSTATRAHGRRRIRSTAPVPVVPRLALHGVTIMRKIAACWTCGRTFWVWWLRERNFCSGKCRVRHHRSVFRQPSRSKSDERVLGQRLSERPSLGPRQGTSSSTREDCAGTRIRTKTWPQERHS